MKAALFYGGKDISVKELPAPERGDDQNSAEDHVSGT